MVNQTISQNQKLNKETNKSNSENVVRDKLHDGSSIYNEKSRNSIADALSYIVSRKQNY